MTTKKQSKTPRPKILFGKAMGHNLYETPGADEIAWLCIPLTVAGKRKAIEAMAERLHKKNYPNVDFKESCLRGTYLNDAKAILSALEKLASTPKG